MRHRTGYLGIAALAAAMALACPAQGALNLSWFTIDGGGATACTGGELTLGGTAGQPDAGALAGSGYALLGGFWMGGAGASGITISEDDVASGQLAFHVSPGLPNPFCSATNTLLELPEPRFVRAVIYDQTGRVVRRLCEELLPSGRHTITWDGTTEAGCRMASGIYLLALTAGDYSVKRSIVLIR